VIGGKIRYPGKKKKVKRKGGKKEKGEGIKRKKGKRGR